MSAFKEQIGKMTILAGTATSSLLPDSVFGPYQSICIHAPQGFTGSVTVMTIPDTSVASQYANNYQKVPGSNIVITGSTSVQIDYPAVNNFILSGTMPGANLVFIVTAAHQPS